MAVTTLIFHQVNPCRRRKLFRLLKILRLFYRILSPEAVFSGHDSPRGFLLTFDDGYADDALTISAVNRVFNIKCIFFIASGFLGRSKVEEKNFLRTCLEVSAPEGVTLAAADWAQVRKVEQAGNWIGFHTVSHRRISHLSVSQLRTEIRESKRDVTREAISAKPIFAYPFGDIEAIDQESLAVCFDHYEKVFSGSRGANIATDKLFFRQHIDLDRPLIINILFAVGFFDFLYSRQRSLLKKISTAQ